MYDEDATDDEDEDDLFCEFWFKIPIGCKYFFSFWSQKGSLISLKYCDFELVIQFWAGAQCLSPFPSRLGSRSGWLHS